MVLWMAAGAAVLLCLLLGGRAYFVRLVDRRIGNYQSDLLRKHCEEVDHMYRQTRGWRHDYHNHIQTMKAYLTMGETERLGKYLDRLDQDLTTVDTVVKTGNVMIDAVLNSKLSLAKARNIAVEAKAIVPADLEISEIDLSLIIGNLMDNAMEACLQIREEEKEDVYGSPLLAKIWAGNPLAGEVSAAKKISGRKAGPWNIAPPRRAGLTATG